MSTQRDINTAIASAYGGGAGTRRERRSGHTFAIVVLVVFFVVMMGCLAVGVSIYRDVAGVRAEADALHMESGLLGNIVRMGDAADAVRMDAGPEGDALVLVERLESGTYETRIYRSGDAVVQEYAIAGREYNPEGALRIIDSNTFEFAFDNGLLTIVTDDGAFSTTLRSHQGPGFSSTGAEAAFAEEVGA